MKHLHPLKNLRCILYSSMNLNRWKSRRSWWTDKKEYWLKLYGESKLQSRHRVTGLRKPILLYRNRQRSISSGWIFHPIATKCWSNEDNWQCVLWIMYVWIIFISHKQMHASHFLSVYLISVFWYYESLIQLQMCKPNYLNYSCFFSWYLLFHNAST